MSSRSSVIATRRQPVAGEIVPEPRPKKWCRLCHHEHALPECGMPGPDRPELPVIDVEVSADA